MDQLRRICAIEKAFYDGCLWFALRLAWILSSGQRYFLTKDGEMTMYQNGKDLVSWGDSQPKVNGSIRQSRMVDSLYHWALVYNGAVSLRTSPRLNKRKFNLYL